MIPTELHLALDFRSGGGSGCLTHWLKGIDAPYLIQDGQAVEDSANLEREELLSVVGTYYRAASNRHAVVLDSITPASMDEYLDRMRELAADGWHQLEDPFVFPNPLPAVQRPMPGPVGVPTQLLFTLEIAPAPGVSFASVFSYWSKDITLPYALQKGSELRDMALSTPGMIVDTASLRLVVREVGYNLTSGQLETEMETKQLASGGQNSYDYIVQNLSKTGWKPYPYAEVVFTCDEQPATPAG